MSSDLVGELQRLAGLAEVSPGPGNRKGDVGALGIDWDGSLWQGLGNRRVPVGRNVRDVRDVYEICKVDDPSAPVLPAWIGAAVRAAAP
jgi:hypothetical protein